MSSFHDKTVVVTHCGRHAASIISYCSTEALVALSVTVC